MCTVVVSIDGDARWPVTLLGLRDEFEDRGHDPFGTWWPELDRQLVGLRDREAGGAWMSASARRPRLAVVLNRGEVMPEPAGGWQTRGRLPLSVASGRCDVDPSGARPHTLVSVVGGHVGVRRWDGSVAGDVSLPDGVHMLTAGEVDDPLVARVRTWLPVLRALPAPTGPLSSGSWDAWLGVLGLSSALSPDHDAALVRRQERAGRVHRTLSLCAAAVSSTGVRLDAVDVPPSCAVPRPSAWASVL